MEEGRKRAGLRRWREIKRETEREREREGGGAKKGEKVIEGMTEYFSSSR